MKSRLFGLWAFVAALLAAPAVAWADAAVSEFPMLVQDNLLSWVFQILSAILIGLSQVLLGGAFGFTV